MSDTKSETTSAAVPEGAKQAEVAQGRWSWVEQTVWSERMLQALEDGVKGDKWFSLIDKVWKKANLEASWEKVRGNDGSAGADGQSVKVFERGMKWPRKKSLALEAIRCSSGQAGTWTVPALQDG